MLTSVETENLFRSIGRLEGKVDAIKDDLAELKTTIKARHAMHWQTYTALIISIVGSVSSGVMLFHFGIK